MKNAELWYNVKMITEGEIIMNTEHRQQKISFWHSMKTQFIAVVILVAAVIVILYTLMIMPGVKAISAVSIPTICWIFPFRMEGRWKVPCR